MRTTTSAFHPAAGHRGRGGPPIRRSWRRPFQAAPQGPVPGLRPVVRRLDLRPQGRAPRPMEEDLRSRSTSSATGRPGGLLEMAVIYAYLLRDGEKARVRRPGQGGPPDLRRLPLRLSRIVDQAPVRLRRTASRPCPISSRSCATSGPYDTLRRLGRLSPAEEQTAADLIAGSMRYLLRTAGMGAHEPFGPPGRDRWPGPSGPCPSTPGRPDLGDAAAGPRRRQLGQLADRGRHHLQRRLALLPARLRRRPEPDAGTCSRRRRCITTPATTSTSMCPAGIVPDLGDAHWTSNWTHFLVFFEAAAAALGTPACKWAAETIAAKFVDFTKPTSVGLGAMLLDAYRWGTDDVKAAAPDRPVHGGHGGRPGQEDRLPQRLVAAFELPPPQLPGRGRRRPELPRLPARHHPRRGGEDDPRPRRREQPRPADVGRLGPPPRRRLPRLHAVGALRRLPPGLLPQPPLRPAREDLLGPEGRRSPATASARPSRASPCSSSCATPAPTARSGRRRSTS
ncbi:MAG: hypothetical protein M0C28_27245 [Candidatus Moduliflexus flocculans]|nr:hypothetical protein [Candidatus Moduliflexus flocculans]